MADITLTNATLAAAVQSFTLMTAAGRELPFPARYAFDKIQRKAFAEYADYEKIRIPLCEEYSAKDSDGKPKKLENGAYDISDMTAFNAAIKPILDEVVTLSGVRKVTIAEMGDVKLTAAEIEGLIPFIDDADD